MTRKAAKEHQKLTVAIAEKDEEISKLNEELKMEKAKISTVAIERNEAVQQMNEKIIEVAKLEQTVKDAESAR